MEIRQGQTSFYMRTERQTGFGRILVNTLAETTTPSVML